jgi:hypothetical protein
VTCKWVAVHFPGRREYGYRDDKGKWRLQKSSVLEVSLDTGLGGYFFMGGRADHLSASWGLPWLGGRGYDFYPKSKDMLKRSRVTA